MDNFSENISENFSENISKNFSENIFDNFSDCGKLGWVRSVMSWIYKTLIVLALQN